MGWSRGLTKETDIRVKHLSESLKQTRKKKGQHENVFDRSSYMREYYNKHKEKHKQQMREHYLKNKERYKIKHKKYAKKLKREVFRHYVDNNQDIKCSNCGIENINVLTLDHINNNGAEHRKILGKTGLNFYCWLRKNNYPDGYQVLCFNCNWLKHVEGCENGV